MSVFSALQVQCRVGNFAGVKGNQVRVLDDPVTVSGEKTAYAIVPTCMRRRSQPMIRKSGNLLKMIGA